MAGLFLFSSFEIWLTVLSLMQEKEMEKQKMLYQQARLHDRGAAEMVLQMISASKGGELRFFFLCAPFLTRSVCGLSSPGRLGAMVTVTLKLGISILNGGNILVQQVHPYMCCTRVTSLLPSDTHCFCFAAENAGLPEGKKRCGVFQKSVWADDVLQVVKPLGFVLSQNDAAVSQFY